uniref:Uncharacterized protein n=1 Tax=Anguilla anguilla TaxID=7936 RepID=A0A0E9UDF7_ANGAN
MKPNEVVDSVAI